MRRRAGRVEDLNGMVKQDLLSFGDRGGRGKVCARENGITNFPFSWTLPKDFSQANPVLILGRALETEQRHGRPPPAGSF